MVDSSVKIAVCFFGITRSLKYTHQSITENILDVVWRHGEVQIFSHFFSQTNIDNPRTGEVGELDRFEYKLLNSDWLEIEEPDGILANYDVKKLSAYGNRWEYDSQSLRNLIHQLHSLNQVTDAAIKWKPNIYLFVRPDLEYLDSFERQIQTAASSSTNRIVIPNWQHWLGGFNDRFAICVGDQAASAYGRRISHIYEYCEKQNKGLHAEGLLRSVLSKSEIKIDLMSLRARRVRFDGKAREEDFMHYRLRILVRGGQRLLREIQGLLKR